ncbi:MAG TPA: hypothetical protein PKN54_08820 [Candidatus Cloacimonas acidaminovorans]|nr:hypothetical protein [Candidatus Cloacimonas acidaminovorans]
MAYTYDFKVVVSGKQVELYKYKKNVWREYETKKDEILIKEPKQLDLFEQEKLRKQRMKFSVNRTRTEIRRLVNSNPQLNKFLTLTFAENITDLKTANYIFNKFILRMNYKYNNFEYLAVPEFQKRGAVHYHLLCNLPFIEIAELQELWGQGFVKINKIDDVNNVGAYVSKYLGKEMDERTFGKKKFFRSQNLKQSVELLGYIAQKFVEKFLSLLTPVYEKVFKSDWIGEVEYFAYSLNFIPFIKGKYDRSVLFKPL